MRTVTFSLSFYIELKVHIEKSLVLVCNFKKLHDDTVHIFTHIHFANSGLQLIISQNLYCIHNGDFYYRNLSLNKVRNTLKGNCHASCLLSSRCKHSNEKLSGRKMCVSKRLDACT